MHFPIEVRKLTRREKDTKQTAGETGGSTEAANVLAQCIRLSYRTKECDINYILSNF